MKQFWGSFSIHRFPNNHEEAYLFEAITRKGSLFISRLAYRNNESTKEEIFEVASSQKVAGVLTL